MRLLQLLRRQEGISLVMAVGVLGVLSIAGSSAIYYSSSNARSASHSKQTATAYSLAEAGIAHALSLLSNTMSPGTATLLPTTTFSLNGGTVTYSGTLTGGVWTITSTGTMPNPTGAAPVTRTITKQVNIVAMTNGSNLSAWDRIYNNDTSACFTIPAGVDIPSNTVARGNLCMNANATISGASTEVSVGGTVTIAAATTRNTGAVDAGAGTGSGWTTPNQIISSNNVYATYSVPGSGQSTTIDATNFGFALPSSASITGISVRVERKSSASNSLQDLTIQLLKGGAVTGNNKATATNWPTSDAYATYGSTTDVWGATLTGADLNRSDFGLRIQVKNVNASARTASIDEVEFTVYYVAGGIGGPNVPVAKADIGSTCKYATQAANSPCSPTDRVWGVNVTTGPTNLQKPTVDFDYWYANAKPGPMNPCTESSGSVPKFDKTNPGNGMNGDLGNIELTPSNADYVCRVKDGQGNLLGELSWNRTTRILKVKGTIFFDGGALFHIHGQYIVHYQGQAMIYMTKGWHNDEIVCAGGSGLTDCRTDMSNWDPTQNLLVLAIGWLENAGNDDCKFHSGNDFDPAFQGVIWTKNNCYFDGNTKMSGPVLSEKVLMDTSNSYYEWPPLGQLLPGQLYGSSAEEGTYSIQPGFQSG